MLLVLSRVVGVPPAPTEWDPELFANAVLEFKLAEHHPHPPGYPVFIWLGRLVGFVVSDPHQCLCWVSVVATSCCVIPFYGLLRRAARFNRTDALMTCATLSFSPVYWLCSGEAVTEPAGLAVMVLATWFAWRTLPGEGNDRPEVWLAFSFALWAVALGIRPQLFPSVCAMAAYFLLATRASILSRILAVTMSAVVCAVWMGWMTVQEGGLAPLVEAFRAQREWWLQNDAAGVASGVEWWRHGKLWQNAWGGPVTAWPVLAFCAVGLFHGWKRNPRWALLTLLWFAPYVMWVTLLQTPRVPRYVIPALPVMATWCVAGLRSTFRRRAFAPALALLAGLTVQGWDVVRMFAGEPLPMLQAMQWCREHVDERYSGVIYADRAVVFARRHLGGVRAMAYSRICQQNAHEYAGWYYITERPLAEESPLFQSTWTKASRRRGMLTQGRYQSAFVYAFSPSVLGEADARD